MIRPSQTILGKRVVNSNPHIGRSASESPPKPVASVIDIFCGAGGLSHGFLLEDFIISCGIDADEVCRYAFEHNNCAPFVCKNIADIDPEELAEEFTHSVPRILVGCAPCQPFSKYTQAREDPRWQLLDDFATLITKIRPDVVSMENVPQLVYFKGGDLFRSFIRCLRRSGYEVAWEIAYCPNFGIPQSRSRLVLIASLHGEPTLPESTHEPGDYVTARDAIGTMPPLSAGEIDRRDSLHRASRLSATNLERIRLSAPGGTWHDWPRHLVTDCHNRSSGKGYASVYGRITWDEPAPTMTTQFHGFGNGRFGHPEQDRAISLREGAILQSFPPYYEFVAPGNPVHFGTLGRLIGNAVPVELARAIARAIKGHLSKVGL